MARKSSSSAVTNADVREDLRRAAAVLFAERGYNATGIQDIAQAANVNKAMLYYYYGNKEELYESLVTQGMELIDLALDAAEADTVSLESRLRLFVSEYLALGIDHPELARIIYREAIGSGEFIRPLVVEYFNKAIGRIAALLVDSHIPTTISSEDMVTYSYMLLGMSNIFISRHFVSGSQINVPHLTDMIIKLFLHGFTEATNA